MPEFEFDASGLSREDEMLAKVVVDLGLARMADVRAAIAQLKEAKGKGDGKSLSEVLRERGHLNPRFASAVEKAVRSRLAAESPNKNTAPTPPSDTASQPQAPPVAASVPAEAGVERPAGPAEMPAPGAAGDAGSEPQLPEAALYKDAPKGVGFSVRSKKDVALAWAAYKKGTQTNAPEAVVQGAPAEPQGLVVPPQDTEKRLIPRQQEESEPELATPTPAKVETPAAKAGFRLLRRRTASSGVTQSIDIESIKAELGINKSGKTAAEPEPVPADPKYKEIALRAFIRRAIPSMLHHRCLEVTLKRRLTLSSPARLAQEVGCSEREARKVLENWKSAGLARQDDPEVFQYQFAPSKADLATIREFMVLWEDEEWHKKLLAWILEEEGAH